MSASSVPGTDSQPLVSCTSCGFAWYGRTAAHGLSVVGHCTRCSGELRFHGAVDDAVQDAERDDAPDVAPSRVLGPPTSWA